MTDGRVVYHNELQTRQVEQRPREALEPPVVT